MIKLNNLSIYYGDNQVLSNINATFESGKHYLIQGKSGLGKTSLLNAILGLIKYEGTIEKDYSKVSMVFQEDRLLEHSNVYTNLKFVQPSTYSNNEYEHKLDEILKQLDLYDNKYSPIRFLSGGMKRRVSIARALLYEGDVLLADEPLKGLDSALQQKTLALMNQIFLNKTIFLVSHQDLIDNNYIQCGLSKNTLLIDVIE